MLPKRTPDHCAAPAERPGQLQALSLPAPGTISVSAVGWTPGGPLHVRRWVACGKRLVAVRSASSWWIGDWMRYGNAQYGEKYGAASLATGYDRQTLMNLAYVASRFPVERRRAERLLEPSCRAGGAAARPNRRRGSTGSSVTAFRCEACAKRQGGS